MKIDSHVYALSDRLRDPSLKVPAACEPLLKAIHHHVDGASVLPLAGVDQILKSMDESQIDRSVLVAFPWPDGDLCQENNEYLEQIRAKHPSRFEMVHSVYALDPKIDQRLKQIQESAAVGVKINPVWQHLQLDSAVLRPILDFLSHQKLYLLAHIDQGFRRSPSSSGHLIELAHANPAVKIVAAHMGGLVGLYHRFDLMKDRFKNIWFDTAVSETLWMIEDYERAGLIDKVVMGSDYPFNQCHSQIDVVRRIEKLDLKSDSYDKVFSSNYLKMRELTL